MKNLIRTLLAATAVAAALAGAVGQGNAAPALHAAKFKHPKLRHGALTIDGTGAGDKIVLRLQGGNPGTLQVDVGDDGSADFSFDRDRIATIAVDAGAGDDLVRIDESNGAFTDSIPTTLPRRSSCRRTAAG